MNRPGHLSQAALTFSASGYFLPDIVAKAGYAPLAEKILFAFPRENGVPPDDPILAASLFLATIAGALFPDLDQKLSAILPSGTPSYAYHRQETHSLVAALAVGAWSLYSGNPYLLFFFLGVASHLVGDMLTGSVPILFRGRYYKPFERIGIDRLYPFLSGDTKRKLHGAIASFFDAVSPVVWFAAAAVYFYGRIVLP